MAPSWSSLASSKAEYEADEDHLMIRSLTKLAQELDREVRERQTARGFEPLHVARASDHGKHRRTYEFIQHAFANLLVRYIENVSVATAGVPEIGNYSPDHIANVSKPHIVISSNPNPDEQRQDTIFPDETEPQKVRVDIAACDDTLDVSKGVIRAVLEATRDRNGYVPVKQHASWLLGLLRAYHSGEDEKTRHAAREVLKQYVHLVCSPKMLVRVEAGMRKKNSNFYELITAPVDVFAQDIFNSLPPVRAEGFVATQSQIKFVLAFWKAHGLDDSQARDRAKPELYDQDGRRHFHTMMSTLLLEAHGSLKGLKKSMEKFKGKNDATYLLTNSLMQDIEDRATRARDHVESLHHFLKIFGEEVRERDVVGDSILAIHLEWLSQVALKRPTRSEPARLKPDFIKSTELAEDDAEELIEGVISLNTADEIEEAADEFRFYQKIGGLPDLQSSKVQGWVVAALKYLHLICLHANGLNIATAFDHDGTDSRARLQSQYILQSTVTVVDIKRDSWADARLSIDNTIQYMIDKYNTEVFIRTELLQKLGQETREKKRMKLEKERSAEDTRRVKQKQAPFTDAERQKHEDEDDQAVKKAVQDYLDDTVAKGAYHCETIIISALLVLYRFRGAEDKQDEWLKCNGLWALKSLLLERLRNPLALLCVSKRCCPFCWFTLKKVIQDTDIFGSRGETFAVPGCHTKSYAVTVPPWLGKSHVQDIRNFAEEEVKKKLRLLQGIITEEANQTAQKPFDSSSSDNAGPAKRLKTADDFKFGGTSKFDPPSSSPLKDKASKEDRAG